MRKLGIVALCLTLVLSLGAVGAAAQSKGTVGGVCFQDNEAAMILSNGWKQAAVDYGYEFVLSNCNQDTTREAEIINTYIASGFAAIASEPFSRTVSVATYQAAADAGIPVALVSVTVDNFPFAISTFNADDYGNAYLCGGLAADFIKAHYTRPVKVAVLQFASQVPEQSAMLYNGFVDAMNASGVPYEIAANQDAWLPDMAVETMGDILSANPDIDIIWCANDGAIVGATIAVENAGLAGKTFVFGNDISEQIVAQMKDDANILQGIVAKSLFDMGYKCCEAAIAVAEGKEIESRGKTVYLKATPFVRGMDAEMDAFMATQVPYDTSLIK